MSQDERSDQDSNVGYPQIVEQLVNEFALRKPLRTKSLVITFFGDIVSQHGGTIWLGSLISSLARFRINERLVRTTVFRLVQDDWLKSYRIGRRSYYQFSDYGEHEYERAAKRIYSTREMRWSGLWQLVVPVKVTDSCREKLMRSLRWQGYRNITPGLLAKPGEASSELTETLNEFKAMKDVLVMTATTQEISSPKLVNDLVYRSWALDEVEVGYSDFLECYAPVRGWLTENTPVSPETAYLIRLMLIQDYRRLLLRDRPVPQELLPPSWPGIEARQIAADIYNRIAPASVEFIRAELEDSSGFFGAAASSFEQRFSP